MAEGLKAACEKAGRPLADARAALPLGAALFDDCLHPNAAGGDRIADAVSARLQLAHGTTDFFKACSHPFDFVSI